MDNKADFLHHLNRSSEIVKDWPSWKQRVPVENEPKAVADNGFKDQSRDMNAEKLVGFLR